MAKLTRATLLALLDSLRDGIARGEPLESTLTIDYIASSKKTDEEDLFEVSGSYCLGSNKMEGLTFFLKESPSQIEEKHENIFSIFKRNFVDSKATLEEALEDVPGMTGCRT